MTAPARALPTRLRPRARVIIRPQRAVASRTAAWILVGLAVTAAFLLVTYARIALDRSAFQLDDLDRRMEAEETRYWQLRVEVAELQAPERITGAAADLGLVYPDRVVTVEVPGISAHPTAAEDRWADLKAQLSARP